MSRESGTKPVSAPPGHGASGHTAAAVAFTTAVAPAWPPAAAACGVPALLVGIERIHSGAHYPSDIAAGAVIGLASAALVRAAPRLLLHLWCTQRRPVMRIAAYRCGPPRHGSAGQGGVGGGRLGT
ncbi:phosphatase PAP2 family protein [Streptomyces sp. NPDC054849]